MIKVSSLFAIIDQLEHRKSLYRRKMPQPECVVLGVVETEVTETNSMTATQAQATPASIPAMLLGHLAPYSYSYQKLVAYHPTYKQY